MLHPAPDNWWHKNRLHGWNYPQLPTKKELIYRILRAAYPDGAFVDDKLNLVELEKKDPKDHRDYKEIMWDKLRTEIRMANSELRSFLQRLFKEESRLGSDPEKQEVLRQYYEALLDEAEEALFISQNGRYWELRCMEEILVRYKKANSTSWMKEPEQGGPLLELPKVEAFQFAQEHLKLRLGGSAARHLQSLEGEKDSTSAASRPPADMHELEGEKDSTSAVSRLTADMRELDLDSVELKRESEML
ncbi:hypothetical protein Hte_001333 [Hypoxylon texense]